MFYYLFKFIQKHKNENKKYVVDHFGGDGIENCQKEELRDYYIALGKWDMCRDILHEIARLFGVDYSDFKEFVKKHDNERK